MTGPAASACNARPEGSNAPTQWRCAKPAGHPYLHETADGGAWGDNTFAPVTKVGMIGPPTIGMVVFEPLTTLDLDVTRAVLASAAAKLKAAEYTRQGSLHGEARAFWNELHEAMTDLHRHFDVIYDRHGAGLDEPRLTW